MTPTERDVIEHCAGLHVGLLTAEETAAFDNLVERGLAYRSYEGTAGFMGVAKVRLRDVHEARWASDQDT